MCDGRNELATNVLELYRFANQPEPRRLAELVTIRDGENVLDAARCLASEVRACGLRIAVWHDLATLAPMVDRDGQLLHASAFGWDAEDFARWQCREKVFQSPLLRVCRIESDPFLISRHGIRTRWENPFLASIALDDFEQRTGCRAAIGIPVHLPFGQIGAAVLTSINPATQGLESAFERYSDWLADAVQRFVRGYALLNRDVRYYPKEAQLSPREIECLGWVAQGKTDYEISVILGRSHAGIRYHLTRACEKLGAANRAQSVFVANTLGMIGPSRP
jgi:DNA-binding CsgD family transcriptional regulator